MAVAIGYPFRSFPRPLGIWQALIGPVPLNEWSNARRGSTEGETFMRSEGLPARGKQRRCLQRLQIRLPGVDRDGHARIGAFAPQFAGLETHRIEPVSYTHLSCRR